MKIYKSHKLFSFNMAAIVKLSSLSVLYYLPNYICKFLTVLRTIHYYIISIHNTIKVFLSQSANFVTPLNTLNATPVSNDRIFIASIS